MITATLEAELKATIRDIPDFPKEGIIFKDITTLLKDKDAFKKSVDAMAAPYENEKIDYVVGVEARGFLFGAVLAYKLGVGFVPVRKKGKLPHSTESVTYDLEYGTDTIEIHEDALNENMRVLVVDDLLATGGTIKAVVDLIQAQKAEIVGLTFLVELGFLNGRDRLVSIPIHSILKY